MKKFLVVLLACAMIFGFATTAFADINEQIPEFSDIADQSLAAKNAIMKLAVLGVIEGNEGVGGAFRPADNLTRAEFAKIVCYLTDNVKIADSLTSVGTRFSDVSTGNWYTGWVNAAAQSGYFVGDPGGTFRPNANITMNEVVTVVLRAAGYNDKLSGTWPANYAAKASNVGLLDDVTFVGSAAATRADMSIICEAVLGINMVTHISNEIAFGLALAEGTADPDGFSEVYYISNETNRQKIYETILHKAFKGVYYDLVIPAAPMKGELKSSTASGYQVVGDNYAYTSYTLDSVGYDEVSGWRYADFASGEIALNISGQELYDTDDKKFEDKLYSSSDSSVVLEYGSGETVAETYYITRGYDVAELGGMQVELTVIDGKAICFVDVVSSYVLANSIHQDRSSVSASSQNVMVDGKSYRPSVTLGVNSRMSNIDDLTDGFVYSSNVTVKEIDEDTEEETETSVAIGAAIQYLGNSTNDDDFAGKVYLDKDGRIYAVKNYDAYTRNTPFAIYDDIDSNLAEWKVQQSGFEKLETNKNYTLYKDGEFVKAEDLDENDLVSYLGKNGASFYYATAPLEGELTQQTGTKLTLAGTGYRVVSGFQYSDDGGETFTDFSVSSDEADFGDAEYAKAYNFGKLAYVAGNLTNQKLIGVITKIEPTQNWSSGSRLERYEEMTIYNSEGKEVTYKFHKDFRDGYTWHVAQNAATYFQNSGLTAADFKTETDGNTKWTAASKDNKGEGIGLLAKGDIVQITVDRSDNVKKITNYASYISSGSAEAKVTSSSNRLTISIPSGSTSYGTTAGTYTLHADAVVYNVTADSKGDYDDVSIQSVASTLAKDFTGTKMVAFDVKTGASVTALYIIGDTSTYQYGVVSGQGRDATDWYYTINGKRVYSESARLSGLPVVISYKVSGGDAQAESIALGISQYLATPSMYYSNIAELVEAKGDKNIFAVAGTAKSYASGTKALEVVDPVLGKTVYVYITSDTYLYDLVKDDDVETPADLKDKTVMAFYDKDNNATFVAIVPTGKGSDVKPGSQTDADAVTAAVAALNTAIGTDKVLTVPYGDDPALAADIIKAVKAIVGSDVVVTAVLNADTDKWEVTLTKNNEHTTIVLEGVVEADPVAPAAPAYVSAAISGNGQTITLTFDMDIAIGTGDAYVYDGPTASNVMIHEEAVSVSAANITDDKLALTLSAPLAGGRYFKVVLPAGTVVGKTGGTANAEINTTAQQYVAPSNNAGITGITVDGVAATGSGLAYAVVLPFGSDPSDLDAADVVVTKAHAGATVGAATDTSAGSDGTEWTVRVTAEDGTTADYVITVTVAPAPSPSAFNTPAAITRFGVTATVTFDKTSPQLENEVITATVTLSGTPTANGTFTIDLTSIKAGLASAPVNEMLGVGDPTGQEYTFTFTMPAAAVDDLTLTLTFAAL